MPIHSTVENRAKKTPDTTVETTFILQKNMLSLFVLKKGQANNFQLFMKFLTFFFRFLQHGLQELMHHSMACQGKLK